MQLDRQHQEVYSRFKALSPPACLCGRPSLFLNISRQFICALCLTPGHLVSLEAADLQPKDIINSRQEALKRASQEINHAVDQKVAQLNTFRQESIVDLQQSKDLQDCLEIIAMQVQGKRDVVNGSPQKGFIKLCDSWNKWHEKSIKLVEDVSSVKNRLEGVDKSLLETAQSIKIKELEAILLERNEAFEFAIQSYEVKIHQLRSRCNDLIVQNNQQVNQHRRTIEAMEGELVHCRQNNLRLQELIQQRRSTPQIRQIEQINQFALDSNPLSIVCLKEAHFMVGTENELIQINLGVKSQLATGLYVGALAVLPDGSLIGSDLLQQKLFQFSAGVLRYLDYATGKCYGLWVRPDGQVLFTHYTKNKVMLLSRRRQEATDILQGQVKLSSPMGLAEVQGLLAIANSSSGVLMVVDLSNNQMVLSIRTVQGVNLSFPQGLTAVGDRLLLCDLGNCRLVQVKFVHGRLISQSIGTIEVHGRQAFSPADCAISGQLRFNKGRVLVADYKNKKLLELKIRP